MKKIQKILLTIPNTRWFDQREWHFFPYTIGLLSTSLKESFQVSVLDANFENLDENGVAERIAILSPDAVSISCMSMEYDHAYRTLARSVKKVNPEIQVIVGGIYPTTLPKTLISDENIDYLIMGEGEKRLPRLLHALNKEPIDLSKIDGLAYKDGKNIILQPILTYIEDLDDLLPSYDYVNFFAYARLTNKYNHNLMPRRFPYALTISSRGCAFNCIFCSSKSINGPTIRYRSADSVLKEIDFLVSTYGIKELIFVDDNLYLNRKRIKAILEGLIDRQYDLEWKSVNAAHFALDDEILELMAKSGCYQISISVESGSKEVLKILKKPWNDPEKVIPVINKVRELNMEISGAFIIGTPGETWDQIRQTFDFAEKLNLDYVGFSIATPLPLTELLEISKPYLPSSFDFDSVDCYGFGKGVISTEEFTPEELQIVRSFEWDRINFKTPEKIAKIAKMMGITLAELDEWRKATRRSVGVHVSSLKSGSIKMRKE